MLFGAFPPNQLQCDAFGRAKTPVPDYNGSPAFLCPSSLEMITARVASGTDSCCDWVIEMIASGLNTERWVFLVFKVYGPVPKWKS